jgi:hypothetical protein
VGHERLRSKQILRLAQDNRGLSPITSVHGRLKDIISDHTIANGPTMSYPEARDAALKAITEPKPVAPASGCSPACLTEQLDAYYQECKDATLRAHDGIGGRDAEESADDGFGQ